MERLFKDLKIGFMEASALKSEIDSLSKETVKLRRRIYIEKNINTFISLLKHIDYRTDCIDSL